MKQYRNIFDAMETMFKDEYIVFKADVCSYLPKEYSDDSIAIKSTKLEISRGEWTFSVIEPLAQTP